MELDRPTVTSAQFDPQICEIEENLETIEEMTRKAKEERGSDLIVFPEAAVTGYCYKSLEEARMFAIDRDGPELDRLCKLAQELDISIVVGAVEHRESKVYNTVFMLEPDGTVFSYHKSHLPFLGVDRFVEPGDAPCAVFDTRFGKVGLIVCYELRFPETARMAALAGARMILQPTNLPEGGESHPDFLTRARACENRVYFISCNRFGTERGFHFIGRSQIVDYNGDVIAEIGEEEGLITARLELSDCEDKDIISAPGERELYLFRHRRWDLYEGLASFPDDKGYIAL